VGRIVTELRNLDPHSAVQRRGGPLATVGDSRFHDRKITGGERVEEPSQQGTALLIDFDPPAGPGRAVPSSRSPAAVSFDRRELTTILNLYGRMVAQGEWRDYALDFLRERALFSIYRRASERPLFVIEKNPKLRNKQGQYLVLSQDGRILRRGHDLGAVLRVLEPKFALVT
jgi:hypothetical protein